MSYMERLKKEFVWIAIFIASIWIVYIFDQFLPLESFGLRPRSVFGAVGIVGMTFLHGSLSHIVSNTVPLITLLLILVGSRANSAFIVILITLIGGLLLWILGSANLHIGASLLVFGLIGFLLINGFFFERKVSTILISIFVFVSYSGTVLIGVIPSQRGISWDGHLCGFIAGVIVAYIFSRSSRS